PRRQRQGRDGDAAPPRARAGLDAVEPRGARPAHRPGPVVARLILDSTVLIAAERRGAPLDQVIGDEDDIAIAAVTAAELLFGVELADARRRRRRQAYVDQVLAAVPIEGYDLDVARA